MGQMDIVVFLNKNKEKYFKVSEIATALNISERNIRRSIFQLNRAELLKSRCRGNYKNWNREYAINNS